MVPYVTGALLGLFAFGWCVLNFVFFVNADLRLKYPMLESPRALAEAKILRRSAFTLTAPIVALMLAYRRAHEEG